MKKKLVFSGLLVVLVCILFGCEQQSKESEPKSNEQEVKSERLKYEEKKVVLAQVSEKEKEKTSSKKTKAPKIKLEKTQEEKKVERKVKSLLKSIERKCKLCRDDLESAGWIIAPEWDAIKRIGKPAIPTLLEVFKDKNTDWRVRNFMTGIISSVLGDDRDRVIRYGYEGVPYFYINKDEEVIKTLIEVSIDRTERESIREDSINLLGEIGDKRAVEPLISILKSNRPEDQDRIFRIRVINSLDSLKDRRAVEPLKEYVMRHYGEKDLAPALYTLCNLGEGSWVFDIVMKMQSDPNCKTEFLSGVLGSTNDIRAVEPLIENLKAGNFWAAEALGRLWKGGIQDDRIIEALIEALKHKDGLVVWEGAISLGKIGNRRAILPLEEALQRALEDPQAGVGRKNAIANALKKLTGRDYQY